MGVKTYDIKNNAEYPIIESIPGTTGGETVTIQIIRQSDSKYWDFTNSLWSSTSKTGNMTFKANEFWSAVFTPDTEDDYHRVTITYNSVNYPQVLHSVGVSSALETSGSTFATTANVKAQFDIDGTGCDTLIARLLISVTKEIQNYAGRKIFSAEYTEYYDGNGSNALQVKEYPITAITSIHDDLDYDFDTDTLLSATDDYRFFAESADARAGIIRLYNNLFTRGNSNIKAVYTGGYASVPADIEQACILLVGADKLLNDLIFNTPIPEGSYLPNQKDPGGMRSRAYKILDQYRRCA